MKLFLASLCINMEMPVLTCDIKEFRGHSVRFLFLQCKFKYSNINQINVTDKNGFLFPCKHK